MSAPVKTAPRRATAPPAGAARWSRMWLDERGVVHTSDRLMPVDDMDRRTPHVRWRCPGHIDVTLADGQSERRQCDHELWRLPAERGGFCPDHGCALEVDGDAPHRPSPWPQLWRAAEAPARPLWALGGLAALGVVGHGAGGAVLPLVPVATVGAYAATRAWLTFGGLAAVRARLRLGPAPERKLGWGERAGREYRKVTRRARLAAYLTAGSGVWLSAAASADPTTPVGKVVWLCLPPAWAVCAAPWWRHRAALRNRPPEPPPAPVVVPEPSEDEKKAADAARLWVEGEIAKNTRLDVTTWKKITLAEVDCGWQAVVVATKRGALNNLGGDNMKATIRSIASAYDVPRSAVTWIEEHEGNPNRALLLIQPVNPLKDGQLWGGPDTIRITDKAVEAEAGRLVDGTPIVDRLYVFGWGAPGEVALGTTGGGKSMRARKRLVQERWASFVDPTTGQRRGLFLSFLHDSKRLESYGEFRDAVHGWGVSRDDAHIMVDAFLRECMRRYDALADEVWYDAKGRRRRGGVKWDPRVHGPIISTHWDEFHELAGDQEFVKKLEKLARYIRAGALRAALYSHMATIGDTGSQALRDMVAGGRATLFRTTSGLNASLATGGQLTADPRALPKLPGMCLVADGETPTLMGRESWIPGTEAEAAAAGTDRTLYDWLFDDDNKPIGFPAEIPPETAEAFGSEFVEWMAAGRSERGREGWSYSGTPAFVPTEERSAQDALRKILFDASGPISRKDIAEHALWVPRSVTSTLTEALRVGRESEPAWVVKTGSGPATRFELASWMRERMVGELAEVEGSAGAGRG